MIAAAADQANRRALAKSASILSLSALFGFPDR
jgi:hypothetical protein